MATLQKIRNRAGILIAVVIGLALLAFILGDFLTQGKAISGRSQMIVAKINGESVYIQDYEAIVQSISNFNQLYYGQTYNDEQSIQQARELAWQELLNTHIYNKEYDKIGLSVHSEELSDIIMGADPHPIVRNFFTDPETNMVNHQALIRFLKAVQNDEVDENQKTIWIFLENEIYKDRFRNKFNTLLNKGIYSTTLEARKNFEENNTKIAFSYISRPFSSISDSSVRLTSKDIENYYKENITNYTTKEETRNVEYILYEVIPSVEDDKAAQKWIDDIKPEFETIEDDLHFINANSDIQYDQTNYVKENLPEIYRDILFDAEKGSVYGPYFENNAYKLAKLSNIDFLPDSVKARHILIASNQNTALKDIQAKADSLMKLIKDGTPFNLLAEQNSDDKASAEVGGDLGWFSEGKMVKPFNDTCFLGKRGDLKQVRSQYGIHIVEITDQSPKVKKVQIGVLARKVTPSSQTINSFYSLADRFAGENNTYEKFKSAASKNSNLIISQSYGLKKNDQNLTGLTNSRSIVQWCFNIEPGIVSPDVFEINNNFVVAVVSKVTKEGKLPLKDVSTEVQMKALLQKKGEILKKEMEEIMGNDKDMESIARKLNLNVTDAGEVVFGSQYPMIRNAGFEPAVFGLVSSTKVGTVAGPVVGMNGVYIIKVENVTAANEATENDLRFSKMQLNRNMGSRNQTLNDAMVGTSNIKDNRINFF